MDKDLYDIMQKIKAEKSSDNTLDVKYLGTISKDEYSSNGVVRVTKDVIAMIDVTPEGQTIIKYYDENQNLIAGRGLDGELFPSQDYMSDDLGFLSEIDSLDETEGISLTELDNELSEISKKLGISKSDIIKMSKAELDEVIAERETETIDVSDDVLPGLIDEEKNKQNEAALKNLNSKQEIDLNKKIDDRLTLAEVLGVPEGSKLIVVYSDQIKDNANSTRFSCIIQSSDGSLQNADMLTQVGGKESDKNVYETNRDGSKVDKKVVQSSYSINSPLVKNGILTVRIGQMGTIEVGYGQINKTSHKDAFTERLEAKETYPITSSVRSEFGKNKGTDNISDKLNEIKEHEKNGCKNMTILEADGNINTGHVHSNDIIDLILSDDTVGAKIDETFTHNEIKERFEAIQSKNPSNTFEENIEITKADLAEDANYFRSHELKH